MQYIAHALYPACEIEFELLTTARSTIRSSLERKIYGPQDQVQNRRSIARTRSNVVLAFEKYGRQLHDAVEADERQGPGHELRNA